MDNNFTSAKEKAVIKGSVLLAVIWDIASMWTQADVLLSMSPSLFEALLGIALVVGIPSYLISLFVKRYNNLYVKCKIDTRRMSVAKGFIIGLAVYVVTMFIFFFVLGIGLPFVYSTIALVCGCSSAYSYLKKYVA